MLEDVYRIAQFMVLVDYSIMVIKGIGVTRSVWI